MEEEEGGAEEDGGAEGHDAAVRLHAGVPAGGTRGAVGYHRGGRGGAGDGRSRCCFLEFLELLECVLERFFVSSRAGGIAARQGRAPGKGKGIA